MEQFENVTPTPQHYADNAKKCMLMNAVKPIKDLHQVLSRLLQVMVVGKHDTLIKMVEENILRTMASKIALVQKEMPKL